MSEDGRRRTHHAKGLRIATRCESLEQFVERFHRFCEDGAVFVPHGNRQVGTETAFSFDLTSGAPALCGLGTVLDHFTTADNRFGRPGIVIGIKRLSQDSQTVLDGMLIARGEQNRAFPSSPQAEPVNLRDLARATPLPVKAARAMTGAIEIVDSVAVRTASIPAPRKRTQTPLAVVTMPTHPVPAPSTKLASASSALPAPAPTTPRPLPGLPPPPSPPIVEPSAADASVTPPPIALPRAAAAETVAEGPVAVLSPPPTIAAPPPASSSRGAAWRRHGWKLALAGAVLVAAIAFLLWPRSHGASVARQTPALTATAPSTTTPAPTAPIDAAVAMAAPPDAATPAPVVVPPPKTIGKKRVAVKSAPKKTAPKKKVVAKKKIVKKATTTAVKKPTK